MVAGIIVDKAVNSKKRTGTRKTDSPSAFWSPQESGIGLTSVQRGLKRYPGVV